MARGGKRAGAGRPNGSRNKKTQAFVEQVAKDGVTPLDVMLKLMRQLWDEATDKRGKITDMDKAKQAEAIATDAAHYVHPKLKAVEHSGDMTVRHEDALSELE